MASIPVGHFVLKCFGMFGFWGGAVAEPHAATVALVRARADGKRDGASDPHQVSEIVPPREFPDRPVHVTPPPTSDAPDASANAW